MVGLSDLTPEVRAGILHNHVYHAAIPVQEKRGFADRKVWEPILDHPNFSPRIIEETLRLRRGTSDGTAMREVRHNLDDPQRIWERIVENDLDDAAVHILEVLFASWQASYDELQEGWSRYRRELDLPADMRAFRQAIRILQGTMLRVGKDRVAFHNPSIEDYLRRHMNLGRTDVRALLRSLRTADDVTHFLNAATGDGSDDGLQEQLKRMPDEVAMILAAVEDTVEDSVSEEDDSIQLHLAWVLEVGQKLGSPKLAEYVESRIEDLGMHVHDGHTPHVAVLADALRADPWVSRAVADRIARQLAEDVLGYIEEGVEAESWGWVIKARRSLPQGFSFVASTAFCRLALDELHSLTDEKYSRARLSNGWDEDTAGLLDFLAAQFPASELPAEFEQVKHRFQAAQDSIRRAAADRRASYPGSVSRSKAIRVGPEAWRRIELLMNGLRHLQGPHQELIPRRESSATGAAPTGRCPGPCRRR